MITQALFIPVGCLSVNPGAIMKQFAFLHFMNKQ